MVYYTLEACMDLSRKYYEQGGIIDEIEEGILGLGLRICHGDGLQTAIIREVPRNEWTSWHTIRMYNRMPKKYAKMIEEKMKREEEAAS